MKEFIWVQILKTNDMEVEGWVSLAQSHVLNLKNACQCLTCSSSFWTLDLIICTMKYLHIIHFHYYTICVFLYFNIEHEDKIHNLKLSWKLTKSKYNYQEIKRQSKMYSTLYGGFLIFWRPSKWNPEKNKHFS